MYFIFHSTWGTPRQLKILMCKNDQKSELEPCYEKRVLRSRSHAHENQELRSWSNVFKKKSSEAGAVSFSWRLRSPDGNIVYRRWKWLQIWHCSELWHMNSDICYDLFCANCTRCGRTSARYVDRFEMNGESSTPRNIGGVHAKTNDFSTNVFQWED